MTERGSHNEQPDLEVLEAQLDTARMQRDAWEGNEIAGAWDTALDFSSAVKLGIGYLIRVIECHELSLQIQEMELPNQNELSETQTLRDNTDNKELLVESARRGIYSPLKRHFEVLISLRAGASLLFASDGNKEMAELYKKTACGFMGIVDALPDRGAPFHEGML